MKRAFIIVIMTMLSFWQFGALKANMVEQFPVVRSGQRVTEIPPCAVCGFDITHWTLLYKHGYVSKFECKICGAIIYVINNGNGTYTIIYE